METRFQGFPKETFSFLHELAAQNSVEWFAAHRGEYQTYVIEPAADLVVDLGTRLQRRVSRNIHADPVEHGSIVPLTPITRPGDGKTIYPTTIELIFWEGRLPSRFASAFFVRLGAAQMSVGAGVRQFSREALQTFRWAIARLETGDAMLAAMNRVRRTGRYVIGGGPRARPLISRPGGDERADFLQHAGLYALGEFDLPIEVHYPEFVDVCMGHFAAMAPLHEWLVGFLNETLPPSRA